MDIRPMTDLYAVSPQISADDIPALKAAGYVAVICNRPDAEVPPDLQAAAIREAAEAAGLGFTEVPLVPGAMGPDVVARHAEAIAEAGGKVLAYCNSGTRSTVAWMLGAAPEVAPETLLQAARDQGYQLDMLLPQLRALHGAG